jgi:outer membrane receptor protein involved in Fe transport
VGGEALRSELESVTLGDRREDRGAVFIEAAAGTAYGDARVARSLGDVHLFADATNLLDERYADIVGRPAPGRTFSVGARVRR